MKPILFHILFYIYISFLLIDSLEFEKKKKRERDVFIFIYEIHQISKIFIVSTIGPFIR